VAAFAPSAMEPSRTDAAIVGTKLVEEGEQIGGKTLSQTRALTFDAGGLRCDGSAQLVDSGSKFGALRLKFVAIRGQQPNRGLRTLYPLHDLKFNVLEITLPACKRDEFCLKGLQLLRISDRSRIKQLSIPGSAITDLLNVGIRLSLVKREIGRDGLGRDELISHPGKSGLDVRKRCSLRHRLVLVPKLAKAGVKCLHLEKSQLRFGICVHLLLPR
jgi:hypothetical protein